MRKHLLFILLITLPFLYSCKEKVTSLVILNGPSISMFVGEADTLEYVIYPLSMEGKESVTWQSSDESVATVKNGVVKALSAGEAHIYATCDKVEAECLVKVSDIKVSETFHDAVLYFMGDRYGKGANNFILRLLGEGLTHNGEGGITGEGYFMNICFNLNAGDEHLLAGDYKCDTTGLLRTFYPGKQYSYYYPGTYYGYASAEGTTGYFIESGTFKVAISDDDKYTISLSFAGSGLSITGSYSGALAEFDASGSYTEKELTFTSAMATTLTGDVEYKQFLITLSGEEPLQLQVNVPLSATSIPNGSYTVATTGGEFSLTPGSQEETTYVGSWLMGTEKVAITGGSVSITSSSGKYTLTCSLYAGDYHLTGTYSGAISFE